mmetsp:Transcript_35997/g.66959  ORF Transcript_35997/g.66959 Transcript_35997/m.66959 type:complete len:217 (+) Transcript_35997:679-1329(+)
MFRCSPEAFLRRKEPCAMCLRWTGIFLRRRSLIALDQPASGQLQCFQQQGRATSCSTADRVPGPRSENAPAQHYVVRCFRDSIAHLLCAGAADADNSAVRLPSPAKRPHTHPGPHRNEASQKWRGRRGHLHQGPRHHQLRRCLAASSVVLSTVEALSGQTSEHQPVPTKCGQAPAGKDTAKGSELIAWQAVADQPQQSMPRNDRSRPGHLCASYSK